MIWTLTAKQQCHPKYNSYQCTHWNLTGTLQICMKLLNFSIFKSLISWSKDLGRTSRTMVKSVHFLICMVPRAMPCSITLCFGIGKSNVQFEDVLEVFELYFKLTKSIYQLWYLLGSCYLGAYENQAVFMNKLNEIASECGFTTKDEVLKLLFLIHN